LAGAAAGVRGFDEVCGGALVVLLALAGSYSSWGAGRGLGVGVGAATTRRGFGVATAVAVGVGEGSAGRAVFTGVGVWRARRVCFLVCGRSWRAVLVAPLSPAIGSTPRCTQ
jgi:hypothetical protein